LGKLKTFSGKELCKLLEKHGFEQVRQRGSHIVMKEASPCNAISEPGGVIISYDENSEPVSVEFLSASKRQLFNPGETSLQIL
jgi:hypothetical protein